MERTKPGATLLTVIPLITKDRTENAAALRIPAAEIEQLVSDRVHRWFLDPGSINKSTWARLADPSIQHHVARAAEIGKHWPELPVARKRPVLTTLIERIDVRVDRIDIGLRPPRLAALLDGPDTPPQGANDEETELLSVPVRLIISMPANGRLTRSVPRSTSCVFDSSSTERASLENPELRQPS